MKPVVYFTALRSGLSLDTPVLDAPVWLPMGRGRPAKQVSNYDGVFKGEISLRRALAESRNAATVHLAQLVGIPAVVRTAHELGIRSNLPPYITTALGAAEVTLLDLANVYRTFASGTRAEPWILRGVIARDGTALFARKGSATPLDDPALPLIQEALRGTVRLPGGTGRSLSSLPFAVIGKTGTTNDYRDALFVGSTFGPSGVTMAVRIGFDDNRSLGEGETGGRTALPVFREAVGTAYAAGLLGPPPRFPQDLEHDIDEYLVASAASPAPASAVPDAQPRRRAGRRRRRSRRRASQPRPALRCPQHAVLAPHGGGLEPADITACAADRPAAPGRAGRHRAGAHWPQQQLEQLTAPARVLPARAPRPCRGAAAPSPSSRCDRRAPRARSPRSGTSACGPRRAARSTPGRCRRTACSRSPPSSSESFTAASSSREALRQLGRVCRLPSSPTPPSDGRA